MTDIHISPAVLEAGARAICLAQGYCWDRHPDFHAAWANEARVAFLAMKAAWEGWDAMPFGDGITRLRLPLTEAPDAE